MLPTWLALVAPHVPALKLLIRSERDVDRSELLANHRKQQLYSDLRQKSWAPGPPIMNGPRGPRGSAHWYLLGGSLGPWAPNYDWALGPLGPIALVPSRGSLGPWALGAQRTRTF